MQKQLIGIRLELKTIEQLKKIAEEKDRTTSNLIRVIIKNYIEQQNK